MAKTKVGQVVSHWAKLVQNLQTSSLDFYRSVEEAIKRREVPEITISRVDMHEGGMLSAKRQYLRVERKRLVFDICAAPFGTGFFFSSWLGILPTGLGIWIFAGTSLAILILLFASLYQFGFLAGLFFWFVGIPVLLVVIGYLISEGAIDGEDAVLEAPIIGWLYNRIFHPNTYYKHDTASMFQSAIHGAVMEVIDEIAKAKNLRPLTELERKPVMKDFFGR
jgi:hypothetical protein